MPYYHECPDCGVFLDPGEICDCHRNKNAAVIVAATTTAEAKAPYTTTKIAQRKENVK